METKWCYGCKEEHALESFWKNKTRKSGFDDCCKKHHKAKPSQSAKKKAERNQKRWLTNRIVIMINEAEKRAARHKLPCDLREHFSELQERLKVGFCELTGIPFDMKTKNSATGPSLDQIIAGTGYPYPNVRIICNLLNKALGEWGEVKLRDLILQWMTNDLKMLAALFQRLKPTPYIRRLLQDWLDANPPEATPQLRIWTPIVLQPLTLAA